MFSRVKKSRFNILLCRVQGASRHVQIFSRSPYTLDLVTSDDSLLSKSATFKVTEYSSEGRLELCGP